MRHVWILALVACGSDGDPDCVDRKSADATHQHKDGNGSYAGVSCVESQCHLSTALGVMAPAYHAAGTVFEADGTTPAAGVTVRFKPLSGDATEAIAITDDAGNFFVPHSSPVPFPAIPEVTGCPDLRRMIEGALDPSYGSCAVNGCHSLDSGRGPITLGD